MVEKTLVVLMIAFGTIIAIGLLVDAAKSDERVHRVVAVVGSLSIFGLILSFSAWLIARVVSS